MSLPISPIRGAKVSISRLCYLQTLPYVMAMTYWMKVEVPIAILYNPIKPNISQFKRRPSGPLWCSFNKGCTEEKNSLTEFLLLLQDLIYNGIKTSKFLSLSPYLIGYYGG